MRTFESERQNSIYRHFMQRAIDDVLRQNLGKKPLYEAFMLGYEGKSHHGRYNDPKGDCTAAYAAGEDRKKQEQAAGARAEDQARTGECPKCGYPDGMHHPACGIRKTMK